MASKNTIQQAAFYWWGVEFAVIHYKDIWNSAFRNFASGIQEQDIVVSFSPRLLELTIIKLPVRGFVVQEYVAGGNVSLCESD